MTTELYREAYQAHHRAIWALCYRMTGSAADADDLVQDTFARALERPPARLDAPLAPWLVKVAINLSRDLLRRRRRRGYHGTWLPGLLETGAEPQPSVEAIMSDGASTEARYDLMESVSFAFLLALEALTPTKRAVLLLREVFGYSVKETSVALDLSEANIKTTLHRAKKEMESYDRRRSVPTEAERLAHFEALTRFFTLLQSDDVAGLERLLADDVRATSDGGGEFMAAKITVVGRGRVLKLFRNLAARRGSPLWFDLRQLNGFPAVLAVMEPGLPSEATRMAFRLELDAAGRIVELQTILATRKLHGVRFPE